MKAPLMLIMLFPFWGNMFAQDINIYFQPKEGGTIIDSIWVTNLRTNEKVKLLGSEILTLGKGSHTEGTQEHYPHHYRKPFFPDVELPIH